MEALVIVFALAVALGTRVYARVRAANGAGINPAEELAQLERYRGVLLEKARRGQQDGWDSEMMNRIACQLDDAERRIGRVADQR